MRLCDYHGFGWFLLSIVKLYSEILFIIFFSIYMSRFTESGHYLFTSIYKFSSFSHLVYLLNISELFDLAINLYNYLNRLKLIH